MFNTAAHSDSLTNTVLLHSQTLTVFTLLGSEGMWFDLWPCPSPLSWQAAIFHRIPSWGKELPCLKKTQKTPTPLYCCIWKNIALALYRLLYIFIYQWVTSAFKCMWYWNVAPASATEVDTSEQSHWDLSQSHRTGSWTRIRGKKTSCIII